MKNGKIQAFTDLLVWQEGHKLVLLTYQITKTFPKSELYSLIDQMQRAAVSVTSNIAEGFGRQTYKEKIQFYYLASGSLTELKSQFLIAKDIGYLKDRDFLNLITQSDSTHRLLNAFITKTRSFLNLKSKI
jgi:four helix bundle protein